MTGAPYDGQTDRPQSARPLVLGNNPRSDGQVTIDFILPETVSGPAELKLSLIGVGENPNVTEDHDVDLILNGIPLETLRWDGEAVSTTQATLADDLLRPGREHPYY